MKFFTIIFVLSALASAINSEQTKCLFDEFKEFYKSSDSSQIQQIIKKYIPVISEYTGSKNFKKLLDDVESTGQFIMLIGSAVFYNAIKWEDKSKFDELLKKLGKSEPTKSTMKIGSINDMMKELMELLEKDEIKKKEVKEMKKSYKKLEKSLVYQNFIKFLNDGDTQKRISNLKNTKQVKALIDYVHANIISEEDFSKFFENMKEILFQNEIKLYDLIKFI